MPARTKSAPPAAIPSFALYGETAGAADAEFIHIELIRARSERFDWQIRSHMHRGLFQVVFLLGGRVRAQLDNETHDLAAPVAIVAPPTVVHGFGFDPDAHGYVLTLATSAGLRFADPRGRSLFDDLLGAARLLDIATDVEALSALLDQLQQETAADRPAAALMGEWLAACVLLRLARIAAADAASRAGSRRAPLFARFRALVEAHYAQHWTISHYADALAVTESRLDRLCRELAGRSAFEIVRQRLLLEAQRRLIYTPAGVADIAFQLGFRDPGYFCRFFKKNAGVTPLACRRAGRAGTAPRADQPAATGSP